MAQRMANRCMLWGIILFCIFAAMSCSGNMPEADETGGGSAVEGPPEEFYYGDEDPVFSIYPLSPLPGDLVMLAVGPLPAGSAVRLETGTPFSASPPYQAGRHTYFLLGIGFQVQPGTYPLRAVAEIPGVEAQVIEGSLEVPAPQFDTIRFSVSTERTSGWSEAQLAADRERVRRARLATEPQPLWRQPFIRPLEGDPSSGYGQIRIINGGTPSHHNGLDIPAEPGTPVVAMNDGVVRLAARLLAHGNMVIIDHGMGLSSSYLHMASIAVNEGQTVGRREVIGAVGDTGFSTGPHLHWEVNLGLQPVNPLQLVQGDLFYLPVPAK